MTRKLLVYCKEDKLPDLEREKIIHEHKTKNRDKLNSGNYTRIQFLESMSHYSLTSRDILDQWFPTFSSRGPLKASKYLLWTPYNGLPYFY